MCFSRAEREWGGVGRSFILSNQYGSPQPVCCQNLQCLFCKIFCAFFIFSENRYESLCPLDAIQIIIMLTLILKQTFCLNTYLPVLSFQVLLWIIIQIMIEMWSNWESNPKQSHFLWKLQNVQWLVCPHCTKAPSCHLDFWKTFISSCQPAQYWGCVILCNLIGSKVQMWMEN